MVGGVEMGPRVVRGRFKEEIFQSSSTDFTGI